MCVCVFPQIFGQDCTAAQAAGEGCGDIYACNHLPCHAYACYNLACQRLSMQPSLTAATQQVMAFLPVKDQRRSAAETQLQVVVLAPPSQPCPVPACRGYLLGHREARQARQDSTGHGLVLQQAHALVERGCTGAFGEQLPCDLCPVRQSKTGDQKSVIGASCHSIIMHSQVQSLALVYAPRLPAGNWCDAAQGKTLLVEAHQRADCPAPAQTKPWSPLPARLQLMLTCHHITGTP